MSGCVIWEVTCQILFSKLLRSWYCSGYWNVFTLFKYICGLNIKATGPTPFLDSSILRSPGGFFISTPGASFTRGRNGITRFCTPGFCLSYTSLD